MKNEYIQRIPSHYVGSDCIQVMIPHLSDKTISILNAEEMKFHYKPNSSLFVNKYIFDERRKQFPYSLIYTHEKRVRGKKIEYINQIFDFNKVYIVIADGSMVTEYYAIKDGEEALLAKKYIHPEHELTKIMNRKEVMELIDSANVGIYTLNGGIWRDLSIPKDVEMLDLAKEEIAWQYVTEYFNKNWQNYKMAISDDVPIDIIALDDDLLVSSENNEIKSIKYVIVKFKKKDSYVAEFYDYPVTIYSLEHIKQLEQTSFKKMPEPKFSKFETKFRSRYINGEKKRILSLTRSKK